MEVRNYKWSFTDAKEVTASGGFEKLFFNAMSLIFPEGERFFVRSVKEFANRAETPKEKEEIKAFIGQEIQHGKAHEFFNESVMAENYDTKLFSKFYDFLVHKIIEPGLTRVFGPEMNLSATAAAEHYTAAWAEGVLRSGRFQSFGSESIHRLMTWHALEELEHKHVAFDLLKKVNSSYALRIGGFAFSTALFIGFMSIAFLVLLAQQKNTDWVKLFVGARDDIENKNGFSNLFTQAFVDYLKPDFHPSQRDDELLRANARKFLEKGVG